MPVDGVIFGESYVDEINLGGRHRPDPFWSWFCANPPSIRTPNASTAASQPAITWRNRHSSGASVIAGTTTTRTPPAPPVIRPRGTGAR